MRVLVCRARPDAIATTRKLASLGHEAISAPVLAIVARTATLPTVLPEAVLLTSRHAAESLTEHQAGRLASFPVYAVGQQTAEAARRRGFADVRIGHGDAASLATLLALTLPAPARLLYLTGCVRKPDFETVLARHRYDVSVLELYDSQTAEPWDADVRHNLASGRIDACLHYSRRSAALAIDFARQGGVASAFDRLRHVCISADTAEPLNAGPGRQIVIARRPSEAAMLEVLCSGPP